MTGSVQLAASPVRAFAPLDDSPLYQFDSPDILEDVDVVSIHEDFVGIPWSAFEAGDEPPGPWSAHMDALVATTGDTPVFLSLALVGGPGRAFLGPEAVVNTAGELAAPNTAYAPCFDFDSDDGPAKQEAFVAYAEWMIDRFSPDWLNIAIEINLFESVCPAQWDALVRAEGAIYDALKASHPDLVIFPSVVLEELYGVTGCETAIEDCLTAADATYRAHLESLSALKRDRFAISTYPYQLEAIDSPAAIPADWFSRAAQNGEPLLIAETGWSGKDIYVPPYGASVDTCEGCQRWRAASADDQAAYFDRLMAEAETHKLDLITWWSHRDLLPVGMTETCDFSPYSGSWPAVIEVFEQLYAESHPEASCFLGHAVFKQWGAMGIRDYDGQPRQPIHDRWTAARARAK